jgi:hypothetical protein
MWYVYKYVNPIDERIFYIGKGKGSRSKVHLYRTKMWISNGKPIKDGSNNLHLFRVISNIWDCGLKPIIEIIKSFDDEQLAYDYEKELIAKFHDSLCNLTNGGEGWSGSIESRKKMIEKRKQWLSSEEGLIWRKKISESMKGKGNPNYGKIEDNQHKIKRMENLLKKEKWNKGMKGDSRCKGHPKGKITYNAKSCIATHITTGEVIFALSVRELSKILEIHEYKISGSSVGRIINTNKVINGWSIKYASTEK